MIVYLTKLVVLALICLIVPPLLLVRSAQKRGQDPSTALVKGLLIGLISLFVLVLVVDDGSPIKVGPSRYGSVPAVTTVASDIS
ncbi:hypothetical protein ACWJJH_06210 [Endozoicomonadaceae bacterium StTr2]